LSAELEQISAVGVRDTLFDSHQAVAGAEAAVADLDEQLFMKRVKGKSKSSFGPL